MPSEMGDVLLQSLPRLLHTSLPETATLIEAHSPNLHEEVLRVIQNEFEGDDGAVHSYLKKLFIDSGETESSLLKVQVDTSRLPHSMLQTFLDLQARLHPETTIDVLKQLDNLIVDWSEVMDICEKNEAWYTVVWALDWKQESQAAIMKSESYHKQLTRRVVKGLSAGSSTVHDLDMLKRLGTTGRDICLRRSQAYDQTEVPLEDLWFGLLSSQIHAVQDISSSGLDNQTEQYQNSLRQLRAFVHNTFTALVSVTSTQAVSFPRLFKRLVSSTPSSSGSQYTEFSLILTGMMESYRSDADMLNITYHLIERDLFDTVSQFTAATKRGWGPRSGTCTVCRQPFVSQQGKPLEAEVIVSRTGSIMHSTCSVQIGRLVA